MPGTVYAGHRMRIRCLRVGVTRAFDAMIFLFRAHSSAGERLFGEQEVRGSCPRGSTLGVSSSGSDISLATRKPEFDSPYLHLTVQIA